jgi:hypothetical protein
MVTFTATSFYRRSRDYPKFLLKNFLFGGKGVIPASLDYLSTNEKKPQSLKRNAKFSYREAAGHSLLPQASLGVRAGTPHFGLAKPHVENKLGLRNMPVILRIYNNDGPFSLIALTHC